MENNTEYPIVIGTGDVGVNVHGWGEQNMCQPNQDYEHNGISNGRNIPCQMSNPWTICNLQAHVPSTEQRAFNAHSLPGSARQTSHGISRLHGSAPVSFSPTQNGLASGYRSPASSISDNMYYTYCTDNRHVDTDKIARSITELISIKNTIRRQNPATTPCDTNQHSLFEREKKKRKNHNEVERGRRERINAYIRELGTLLSDTIDPSMENTKGKILGCTVDYIKKLKSDQEKIPGIEKRILDLEIQNRLLLKIIGEKEKILREHGIIHEVNASQLSSVSPFIANV